MQMLAVVITKPGGPDVLEVCELPIPEAQASEVLVRVHASSLNRADLLQRRGRYPAPPGAPADIPGIEFAGEVTALGGGVQLWKRGDRVMGIAGGGAQAQYIAVHERTLVSIPGNLSWTEAGSIPEAFITAHDALWIQAGLRPNERVLIHAVGSGVGLAALQLTRAMNAVPVGTSRTADKLEEAKKVGLESGFVVPQPPVAEDAKQWAAKGTFDVVIDLAGGPYASASLRALSHCGRMILVGTMAGAEAAFDLGVILGKRAHIIGTVLRTRPLEEKISAARRFANEVVPLFARGLLKTVIDREFPLREVREAHQRMESNQSFGKIVLRMPD